MRHWTCKCGKCEAFGSDPPPYCSICKDCGTNYMGEVPKEHKWIITHVETDEGLKVLTRCGYCYKTKKQIEQIEKLS